MRKLLSFILTLALCLSLVPAAYAGEEAAFQYVNATGWSGEEPTGVAFSASKTEDTIGIYITGACELKLDCSDIVTVINNAAVTVGEGGKVNTQELYIFGTGSLTVGNVVFKTGHSSSIGGSEASDVLSATEGNEMLNISGELGTGGDFEEVFVYKATVAAGEPLTLGENGVLIIASDGNLTVQEASDLKPSPNASINVCQGATACGMTLYDSDGTTKWTSTSSEEVFVWQDSPVQKWVRDVYAGFYEKYMVEFEVNGKGSVTVTADNQISSGNMTKAGWSELPATISFTVTPEEGERLEAVWIEQEAGGNDDYDALSNGSSAFSYDEETNSATLTYTTTFYDEDGGFALLKFNFSGGPAPDPETEQYTVRYSEIDGSSVALTTPSSIKIESGSIQEFTSGSAITWKLTYPEGVNKLYYVEINEMTDSGYMFKYIDGDLNNSPEITVDNTSKELSFTPNTESPFEVILFWTEEECDYSNYGEQYMIEFETNGAGTVTVNDSSASQITYGNMTKIGWDAAPQSVTFTVTPDAGEELLAVWIEQEAGEDDSYNALENGGSAYNGDTAALTYEPFIVEGDPNDTGFAFLRFDFSDNAKDYIESWNFAYYGTTSGAIKSLMATELWNENFSDFGGHEGQFTGMFVSLDEFCDAITLSGTGEGPKASDNDNLLILPYYEYEIALNTADNAVATGNVYVLDNDKQFVVMDAEGVCTIVDTTNLSGESMDIYVCSSTESTEHTVFGNGVCEVGSLDAATGDYEAYHVTQEHSGINTGLGCRLAVFPKGFESVTVKGSITAASWGFAEIPVFSTSDDQDDPSICEIYYGNDGTAGRQITVSSVQDDAGSLTRFSSKAITAIAVDTSKISAEVADITDNPDGTFSISFNSAYDTIPLVVTYADSTVGYIEIHRVGLHMTDDLVTSGQYSVWHGTDDEQKYSSDDEKVVTAAFYYNTGTDMPTEHVSLFVTVVTASGTTRKIVDCVNSDFIPTTGGDKFADDFLLWSGSAAEYDDLISVSAIVYSAGDEDSFGGVKVGSGTGVEWVKVNPDIQ